MKRKQKQELKELGAAGLKEKLKELKTEQFNLRFQTKLGEVSNPLRLRIVRRDIARVATILRETELKKMQEKAVK
jgi:large subunit ribosomal protein L29